MSRAIRSALTRFFSLVPEEEFRQSEPHLRELTVRWLRAIALLMAAATFLAWPTDWYFFSDHPEYQRALLIWRVTLGSTTLLLAFGFTWMPWLRRNPGWAFSAAALVVMGVSGYVMGGLGGIDHPFFYSVYPIPATTVALLVPLPQRIGATLAIVVSYLVAFVWTVGPAQLSPVFLGPVLFLASSCIGMVFIGHVVYRLVGSNHVRAVQLSRLLESHKRDLALATREALTSYEKVRERLLYDLHDNVGPIITALHLETYATRHMLQRDGCDGFAPFVDTVDRHTASLKQIIRSNLRDLDPYAIDRGTLTEIIRSSLDGLLTPAGLPFECSLDEAINRIPGDVKQALHLIVRECANNTVKHAQARHVQTTVVLDGDTLRLVYADDGRGFDMAALNDAGTHGYGLVSIRLRAIDIGGCADLSSKPGKGFFLRVDVPLTAAPEVVTA